MNGHAQDARTVQFGPAGSSTPQASPVVLVRHFRQILLWPLRVMPDQAEGTHVPNYWEPLEALGEGCPWREVVDEFGDPKHFQERHHKEFITFLPYVQRFLYGDGKRFLLGGHIAYFI